MADLRPKRMNFVFSQGSSLIALSCTFLHSPRENSQLFLAVLSPGPFAGRHALKGE